MFGQLAGPGASDLQSAYLRVWDRHSNLKHGWVDPLGLRFTAMENQQAPLVFSLPVDDPIADLIEEFDIIEVRYRSGALGLTEYTRAFVGIVRDFMYYDDSNGLEYIEFTAPHINHILDWSVCGWASGVANRSVFTNVAADTILTTLVLYNLGGAAHTESGRLLTGALFSTRGAELTIEASPGVGSVLSTTAQGGGLLQTLQRISEISNVSFEVEWLGQDEDNGWTVFNFRTFLKNASDKSNEVILSKENGTLLNPRFTKNRQNATVVIAAGQGQAVDRAVSIVQSDNYNFGTRHMEGYADARSESTEAGRIAAGNKRLYDLRGVNELAFDVYETRDAFYSPEDIEGLRTFKTGDIIRVDYRGSHFRKVQSVTLEQRVPGDRAVSIKLETTEV